jgi:hypothetical protein
MSLNVGATETFSTGIDPGAAEKGQSFLTLFDVLAEIHHFSANSRYEQIRDLLLRMVASGKNDDQLRFVCCGRRSKDRGGDEMRMWD